MRQTCQSREETRSICGQNSNRGRRQLRPSQPGEYKDLFHTFECIVLPFTLRLLRLNVLLGWWQTEAGESKNHAERLLGLQWLHYLRRECPHHTAEPRGAFESAGKQQGMNGYMHS